MSSFGLPLIALFLSTPSARRATRQRRPARSGKRISIHALREEGDDSSIVDAKAVSEFLSTPSARRATAALRRTGPRRGISIHALREEGDTTCSSSSVTAANFYPRPPRGGRLTGRGQRIRTMVFLSTPSARRATLVVILLATCSVISIHALREEGDRRGQILHLTGVNFYPRPPRGGRRDCGDKFVFLSEFLSTPSARRATRCPPSGCRS